MDDFRKMMEDEMARAAAKVTLDDVKKNIDVYCAASEGCALVLKSWYDGFVKAGFDTTQAMYLTGVMSTTLVAMAMAHPPEQPPKGR